MDIFRSKCVFPFKYEGKTYTKCITNDNSGGKWCATAVYSDGSYLEYGYCSPDCDIEEKPSKTLSIYGVNMSRLTKFILINYQH